MSGLTAAGAITALVDRLKRAGYVTHEGDAPTNRRTVIVDTVVTKIGPRNG